MERGPLPDLRFNPNPSPVAFHHFLADRQSDAGAGILPIRMQALKDHENLVRVLWIQADTVIAHCKSPFLARALGGDVNSRRLIFFAKFDCVAEEVLKNAN